MSNDIETCTGSRYAMERRDLYKATIEGNVEQGLEILANNPSLLNEPICEETGDTALHLAVRSKHIDFVNMLIRQPQINFGKNKLLKTPFCVAMEVGHLDVIKVFTEGEMVMSEEYTHRGADKMIPLTRAVCFGHTDAATYLFEKCKDRLEETDIVNTFLSSISNEMFDFGLLILDNFRDLELDCARTLTPTTETALHMLARNASLFPSTERKWTEVIAVGGSWIGLPNVKSQASNLFDELISRLSQRNWPQIVDVIRSPSNVVVEAAKARNYNFIVRLVGLIPELCWERDERSYSILHLAVRNRDVKLFDWAYTRGSGRDCIQVEVENRNNILHLAAMLPPKDILGATIGEAFQLQKEILFFKDLEKLSLPAQKSKSNSQGKIPLDLFFEEHANLSKKTENCIRTSSILCGGVATLMILLVFPMLSSKSATNSWIENNAMESFRMMLKPITLFFSIVSLALLVCVAAFPYKESNFVRVFPRRFRVGVTCLCISMVSMTLSSSDTMMLVYSSGYEPLWSFDMELLQVVAFNLGGLIFMLILLFYIIYPYFCAVISAKSSTLLRY